MAGAPTPIHSFRRRVQTLERDLIYTRRQLDILVRRSPPLLNQAAEIFVAVTAEDDAYPPAPANVFGITFCTVAFTRAEGQQTPTYTNHSASVQEFALSLSGYVEEGTRVLVKRQRNGQYVIVSLASVLRGGCLAEAHPGRGTAFDIHLGTWSPANDKWIYAAVDTVKAIDWRYGVPYPGAGATGLFAPMPSDTYGTIWENVALDCDTPGACGS
jgi:hypothetical protein